MSNERGKKQEGSKANKPSKPDLNFKEGEENVSQNKIIEDPILAEKDEVKNAEERQRQKNKQN